MIEIGSSEKTRKGQGHGAVKSLTPKIQDVHINSCMTLVLKTTSGLLQTRWGKDRAKEVQCQWHQYSRRHSHPRICKNLGKNLVEGRLGKT
jgi:hypothetical protein